MKNDKDRRGRRIYLLYSPEKLKGDEDTRQRRCYHTQHQKRLEYAQKYRKTHQKEIREYREANRIAINQYSREYRRRQLKEDPTYILRRREYSKAFIANHPKKKINKKK